MKPLQTFAILVLFTSAVTAADLPEGAISKLGSNRLRHPDRPLALAFRPGAAELASLGSDGQVRIWEVPSGTLKQTIKLKDNTAHSIHYTVDGTKLFVQFGENQFRSYDPAAEYKLLKNVPIRTLENVTLTNDAKLIAGVQSGKLQLLELANGQDRMELTEGIGIAISPNGETVAIVDMDRVVRTFVVPSGKPIGTWKLPKSERAGGVQLAFNPNSQRLAIAESATAKVHVIKLDEEKIEQSLEASEPITFVSNHELSCRIESKLTIWDIKSQKKTTQLGEFVSVYAMSPNQKYAATDGGSRGSARIRLWDMETKKEIVSAEDTVQGIRNIKIENEKLIFDNRESRWTWVFSKNDPPQRIIVSENFDELYWVNSLSGNIRASVALESAQKILIRSTTTNTPKFDIPVATQVLNIALSPDGTRLAMIGRDGFVRVWQIDKGQPKEELWKSRVARSQQASISFSQDGKTLAASSIMRVTLFNSNDGKTIHAFDRTWEDGPYTNCAFSPDGGSIAAGTMGAGGSSVVWELATRSISHRFDSNGGTVSQVAFGTDGKTLVSLSTDDSVVVWDLTGRHKKKEPTKEELSKAWLMLGASDAKDGSNAHGLLISGGSQTIAIIRDGIAEVSIIPKRIAANITDLESSDFKTREKAKAELVAIGGASLPALKLAMKDAKTVEAQMTAGELVEKITKAASTLHDPELLGDPLRMLRAIRVLKAMNTDDARKLIVEIEKLKIIPKSAE